MSKLCLYLTFALVLCLFAANSSANPKPNPTDIEIIINKMNKPHWAEMPTKMNKPHWAEMRTLPVVKGTYFLTLWPGIFSLVPSKKPVTRKN